MRTCRRCGDEFELKPGKPGLIDECPNCATDVPLTGGNMVWHHKTAPTIELRPLSEARRLARLTSRFSYGVTKSLTR